METRRLIAYALILALLVAPFIVRYVVRRGARRDRKDAERPIRITRNKRSRD